MDAKTRKRPIARFRTCVSANTFRIYGSYSISISMCIGMFAILNQTNQRTNLLIFIYHLLFTYPKPQPPTSNLQPNTHPQISTKTNYPDIREQFKLAPKDKYVSVGESSSFDCLPQAWPEPQIQWRFNGQPIELNGTRLPDGSHKYQVIKLAKTDIANTNMDRQQIVNSTPSQSSAWHTQQGSILTTKSPADKGNGNGKAIANSNFADQDHSSPWSSSQPVMIDLIGSRLQIRNIDKSDEGKYSCLVETRGSHRLIERESPQAQLLAFCKWDN